MLAVYPYYIAKILEKSNKSVVQFFLHYYVVALKNQLLNRRDGDALYQHWVNYLEGCDFGLNLTVADISKWLLLWLTCCVTSAAFCCCSKAFNLALTWSTNSDSLLGLKSFGEALWGKRVTLKAENVCMFKYIFFKVCTYTKVLTRIW